MSINFRLDNVSMHQHREFNTVNFDKHSLRYQGPLLWSKLSVCVRTVSSVVTFKRAFGTLDLQALMDHDDTIAKTLRYLEHSRYGYCK